MTTDVDEEDFDVVIHALTTHRDKLWKMTQQNINCGMFNITDQIRYEQIDKLDKAIVVWNELKVKYK